MFRFTIRELLLLTVIAGMGIAWWIDRCRRTEAAPERDTWQRRVEAIKSAVILDGYKIRWDKEGMSVRHPGGGEHWTRTDERLPPAY